VFCCLVVFWGVGRCWRSECQRGEDRPGNSLSQRRARAESRKYGVDGARFEGEEGQPSPSPTGVKEKLTRPAEAAHRAHGGLIGGRGRGFRSTWRGRRGRRRRLARARQPAPHHPWCEGALLLFVLFVPCARPVLCCFGGSEGSVSSGRERRRRSVVCLILFLFGVSVCGRSKKAARREGKASASTPVRARGAGRAEDKDSAPSLSLVADYARAIALIVFPLVLRPTLTNHTQSEHPQAPFRRVLVGLLLHLPPLPLGPFATASKAQR
jgi:hypothetical protein